MQVPPAKTPADSEVFIHTPGCWDVGLVGICWVSLVVVVLLVKLVCLVWFGLVGFSDTLFPKTNTTWRWSKTCF